MNTTDRKNRNIIQKITCSIMTTMIFMLLIPAASAVQMKPVTEPEERVQYEPLSSAWFDDAFFFGDSLTGSLDTYNLRNDVLGDADILYVNGYTCRKAAKDHNWFYYCGQDCTLEKAIALSGAKKAFILLAMNDLGHPAEEIKESWNLLIDNIQKDCPDVEIYIQSATPVLTENNLYSNKSKDEYNEMLQEVCEEKKCIFVDISYGLDNEFGFLKTEYSKDGVHLNDDGCSVWVKNLKDPASYSIPPVEKP